MSINIDKCEYVIYNVNISRKGGIIMKKIIKTMINYKSESISLCCCCTCQNL